MNSKVKKLSFPIFCNLNILFNQPDLPTSPYHFIFMLHLNLKNDFYFKNQVTNRNLFAHIIVLKFTAGRNGIIK